MVIIRIKKEDTHGHIILVQIIFQKFLGPILTFFWKFCRLELHIICDCQRQVAFFRPLVHFGFSEDSSIPISLQSEDPKYEPSFFLMGLLRWSFKIFWILRTGMEITKFFNMSFRQVLKNFTCPKSFERVRSKNDYFLHVRSQFYLSRTVGQSIISIPAEECQARLWTCSSYAWTYKNHTGGNCQQHQAWQLLETYKLWNFQPDCNRYSIIVFVVYCKWGLLKMN